VQCSASSAAAEKATKGRSAAELRARAQRLFQAHKFSLACPTFEAAALLAPREPALFVELALCQHQLEDDALARQSNFHAIALASEKSAIDGDAKMARLRRNVYSNLAALSAWVSEENAEPTALPANCGKVDRAPGCAQTFFACTHIESGGGSAALYGATHVRIARTLEYATFDDYELFDDYPSDIDAKEPVAPIVIPDGARLQYVESYDMEARTYSCDWYCENSEAVAAETAKCRWSTKTAPADRDSCAERVCTRAERTPWAAVKAELATSDACYRESEMFNRAYGCTFVYANACTGLIGLVCKGESAHEKPRTRVLEYRFEPAASADMRP